MVIGGHRGMGETDSDKAKKMGINIPPENSLESFEMALKDYSGVDFIETDAVACEGGEIFLIHSNDPKQHVTNPPGKFIGDMTFEEVKKLKLANNETIPTLLETLKKIKDSPKFFSHNDILINIELKGVQETQQRRIKIDDTQVIEQKKITLARGVINAIINTKFPLRRILFSSFSAIELSDLLKELEKSEDLLAGSFDSLNLAFLFYPPELAEKRLYHYENEEYRSFNKDNIETVLNELPQVKTLIPEIKELISEKHLHDPLGCAKEKKLNIMTYSTEEIIEKYKKDVNDAFKKCSDSGIETFGVITDYIDETKALFQTMK